MNIKNNINKTSPTSAINNEIKQQKAVNQASPQVKPKKESIFSGILASTAKPFRTSSMSIVENLSNKETRITPQRSQTMLISNFTENEAPTVTESSQDNDKKE